MQKGQTPHTVGYTAHSRCKVIVSQQSGCSRYTVGMQYAGGVSAKKSLYPHAVDAVGVGAKRSIETVYSANKGGGGRYL